MFNIYDLRERYPDFVENSAKCTDGCQPCIVCGRSVKKPTRMVHLSDGGTYLVTEEEAKQMSDRGDMGMWPIGPDCYHNNPEIQPYVQEQPVIRMSRWKRLYFDLYRQTCGDEEASDDEVMHDAYRRMQILKDNGLL